MLGGRGEINLAEREEELAESARRHATEALEREAATACKLNS